MQNNQKQLSIILFQPEIPPNTGNIIRLCANTGAELHLIKPLGFPLDDKKLRRSGLDYHEYTNLVVHNNWENCRKYFAPKRIIAIETCGEQSYHEVNYLPTDALLFGSETKGLPQEVLAQVDMVVKIPMVANQRSLNLSNSVAITLYEAWRQLSFRNNW